MIMLIFLKEKVDRKDNERYINGVDVLFCSHQNVNVCIKLQGGVFL